MLPEDAYKIYFRQSKIFAFLFLVVAPVLYLIVAFFIKIEKFYPENFHRLMFYVLLIMAFIQPLFAFFIKKFQITNYLKNKKSKMTPGQFYINILIIQLAFVEAIFIYGLIVYIITESLVNMLYFYLIGVVWSVVCWPRDEKTRTFIKSLEVQ